MKKGVIVDKMSQNYELFAQTHLKKGDNVFCSLTYAIKLIFFLFKLW